MKIPIEPRETSIADALSMLGYIRENGACRGVKMSEFTSDETVRVVPLSVRNLCDSCEIKNECLSYALHYERFNIWAATTEHDRKILRKTWHIRLNDIWSAATRDALSPVTNETVRARTQKNTTFTHGTPAGWRRERRMGVAPCDECQTAWNAFVKATKDRLREKKQREKKELGM